MGDYRAIYDDTLPINHRWLLLADLIGAFLAHDLIARHLAGKNLDGAVALFRFELTRVLRSHHFLILTEILGVLIFNVHWVIATS